MNYLAVNAICPFFEGINKKHHIRCEGIVSDTCENVFPDKDQALEYFKEHCCCNFEKCKIAQYLEKKYDFEVT